MAGQKKRSVTPPKEEDKMIRLDPRESDGTFNNGPPPGYRDAPSGPTYTPLPAPPVASKPAPPAKQLPAKPKYPGKPASPKAKPSPARQLPAKPKPGMKYPLGTATKKKK